MEQSPLPSETKTTASVKKCTSESVQTVTLEVEDLHSTGTLKSFLFVKYSSKRQKVMPFILHMGSFQSMVGIPGISKTFARDTGGQNYFHHNAMMLLSFFTHSLMNKSGVYS